MNRIPVIIHESDMTPGLANKISIPFATKVCVTFPESLTHIQGGKSVLPACRSVNKSAAGKHRVRLQLCDFHTQKPVFWLWVEAWSQVLIKAVRDESGALAEQFQIVHICGKGNIDTDHLKHEAISNLSI